MSMKVTESLRSVHRPKYRKRSKKWEEARAKRAAKRVGLKQQPRDPLGFIVYTDAATGEKRVKPDSRRAHEQILLLKLDDNEMEQKAEARKRRNEKAGKR